MARWTVDAARLRGFTQQIRSRYGASPYSPTQLLEACDQHSAVGLEVVCREDAVFVGPWCLSFDYNEVSPPRLEDTWLEFEMEQGLYFIPVPFPESSRAEVERLIQYYTRQGEENRQRAIAERQAPTWSNRLLNVAEPHFIWVALGFFFIAIPVIVLVLSWLRGGFL